MCSDRCSFFFVKPNVFNLQLVASVENGTQIRGAASCVGDKGTGGVEVRAFLDSISGGTTWNLRSS